jgi:predicted nucleic acid-binding protein
LGSLTVPSGTIYLDTDSIIYSVEKVPKYWPLLQPLWAGAGGARYELVSSELALLETLVGPLKASDLVLEAAYESLLLSTEMRLIPITLSLLRRAAHLRASHNLRTPDAIHAATALEAGCALFVTNDRVFARMPQLNVTVLDDLLP